MDGVVGCHHADAPIVDPIRIGTVLDPSAIGRGAPLQKGELAMEKLGAIGVRRLPDLLIEQLCRPPRPVVAVKDTVAREQHAVGGEVSRKVGLHVATLGEREMVFKDLDY